MVHYATYYATFERIDMTPAYLSNFFQRDKLSEAGQIYVTMAKKKRADRNPTPVPTGRSPNGDPCYQMADITYGVTENLLHQTAAARVVRLQGICHLLAR